MWSTILIILATLVLISGILKIWLDLRRGKTRGLIMRQNIFLLLLAIAFLVIDVRCGKEADVQQKQEQVPKSEEKTRIEYDPVKRHLAQLQDYIDDLDKSDKPQLKLYFKEGMEYRIKEDYKNALETFKLGLDLKVNDSEKTALYILTGNSSAFLKEYDDAINYYYKAEALAKNAENDSALVVCLTNLALLYQIEEDFDEVLDNYFGLVEVFKRIGDEQSQRSTYANIGLIYQMKGELDSASAYQERTVGDFKDSGDLMARASQLNNLGLIYTSKGNLDSALVLHQEALKIFQQLRDKRDEASTLSNIGLIFHSKGELKEALEYHHIAFVIDSTIGHVFGQAGDLTNIGAVHEELENYTRALEFYQRGFSLFEKAGAAKESDFVKGNIQRVEKKMKK
jgi:tetratricopeptide (TPR) repeat protein